MRALVISGMALIAATYGLARFGFGLFLPRFAETFPLDPAVSGTIQAGSFLSYCVAAVIATRLGARPRSVVVLAGTTASVGSMAVAVAPHPTILAIGVVLAGAGAGFATPGLVTLVERNVAPGRQENAQTAVNAGSGAGIVASGALLLLVGAQWRLGWVAIAVIAAGATAATLCSDRADGAVFSPAGPTTPAKSPTPAERTPAAEAASGASRPGRVGAAGALAHLTGPLAAALLAGSASAAIWTFGPMIMVTAGGTDAVVAWMVLGGFGMLGGVAGVLVQRWTLVTAWTLTAAAMAVATVALGLAPGTPAVVVAAVALFGAGYTALSGVLIVWAVRVVPDQAAVGTVALFIALAVGQAAGSVALGVLLGATTPALTFAVAGLLAAVAMAPALVRRRVATAPRSEPSRPA